MARGIHILGLCCCLSLSFSSEAILQQKLTPIIKQAPQGAGVAVAVYDIAASRFIYRHNADSQLRMASLAKLVVSAAALEGLGTDYHFRTSLHALGTLDKGTLPQLGLIARGDPCLDEHFTNKKPNQIFIDWAKALQQAGVQRVSGDLVVDTSFFSSDIFPASYPTDHKNRQSWYSAPASAFAWNDNCIEVQARPGAAGTAAIIQVRPRSSLIPVVNRARSVAGGGSKGIIVSRAHKSNQVTVSGSYSKPTSWFPLAIHEHPNRLAADHFRSILADNGITIAGKIRFDKVDPNTPILHQHQSPLIPALNILNQRSQNFYGEQILRVIGQEKRNTGSIPEGVAAIQDIFQTKFNLPKHSYALVDGSGLGYDNTASAWFMCQLLAHMHRSTHATLYHVSLKEKWSGKQRARVKTGTLAIARCLAGYIDGGNKRYAFAILLNKKTAKSWGWSGKVRDGVFHAIVQSVNSP